MSQKYASQAVEDLKESSGLFDNVDATITNVQFTKTAPDGYQADGSPIFSVVNFLINGAGAEDERKVSQSYSLGASAGDNFTIGADGYGLIPNTDDSSLRKDSKWGTFLAALSHEGLNKSILQNGDFSKLIGLNGRFKRVADKERSFTSDRAAKKSKFPPSTLVCTKINTMPGVVAAGASAAPVAAVSDIDTLAGAYLAQVVKAKGGKVQRSQILLLVATAAKAEADKQAIAKRATEEAFLNGITEAGGVVDASGNVVALSYDGTAKPQVVSIAA